MVTRLLDDQHIRRRRSSRRNSNHRGSGGTRRESVLLSQPRVLWSERFLERLAGAARVGAMVVVIGGLVTGLVAVSGVAGSTGLTDSVVGDDLERAAMPIYGAPATGPVGGVDFERTEDTEYVVSPGETLSEIAHRFDLSYDVLAGYNEIADPDTVMPGQRILIPSVDLAADLTALLP